MKRFLSAIVFCIVLMIFGLVVLLPPVKAEKSLLENLLNLPAPPPPNPFVENDKKVRAGEFFDRNKPPADDAPIEDLLAYWRGMNEFNRKMSYAPEPSAAVLQKLMDEIGKNPETLPGLINALPETDEAANFVKRLYEQELSERKYEREWRDSVKRWLMYHSDYYSSELADLARQAADTDEYVSNQEELLALSRVDWDKARPILEKLLNDNNQPISQTLANWAFYEHAMRSKDSSDIEKYRKELQATVENKSAKPGNRDLAMDAIIETGDFDGRDDWYFSLLSDETLHDLRVNGTSYTGLTTILNHSPSDKYTAKMLELVKSDNPKIRSAVVRNLSLLLSNKNPEVVRALLPWLEDANWAKETNSERQILVTVLREIPMPESVPGLIAILNEKQPQSIETTMNANSSIMSANRMATNINKMLVNTVAATVDYYPYRDGAIVALAAQRDFRAVEPLRFLLPQVEEWQRNSIVQAMLNSHGFSVPEQIEALESVAKEYRQNLETMVGNSADTSAPVVNDSVMTNANYSLSANRPYNPSDIKPILGTQLISQTEAEADLVSALSERINVLDTKDPLMASALRKIMQSWNGAAINAMLLKDLKFNKADTDSVVKLLSLRKSLRETQSGEVFDVRGGNPTAIGIAACLIEDSGEYNAILAGENIEAKAAMLSCARLIRARLPIQKVAENLKNPNRILALAAERYLESEDSPEARTIVLALHPNEAKILGARTFFSAGDESFSVSSNFLPALFSSVDESLPGSNYYIYEDSAEPLIAVEKKLQKEIKENQELLGIYAYNDNFVRIYKDHAVFSWQEDKARYRERNLTKEEFDNFRYYLTSERVNELPPFLTDCEEECKNKELIMLGRQGGRRIFTVGNPKFKFFAGLDSMFTELQRPPAKLHYWLEKNIEGLQILFEDENLQAETLWKNGDDFRVLINNSARRKQIDKELQKQDEADEDAITPDYEKIEETRQKRRLQREFENLAWYKFAGNQLGETIGQPAQAEVLPNQGETGIHADNGQWKAKTAAFEIRGDEKGLYKIARGQVVKIREGYFEKPLVTPNGRWAIVTKYDEEEGKILVRVNLLTNKEFKTVSEDFMLSEAVAFIPSLNKVLVFSAAYQGDEGVEETEEEMEKRGEYLLLDAETGALQKTKGEIRPIAQQTFRALQPTGTNPDEVWAAIPDSEKNETQVGVFNIKTLVFKSSIKIPQITFNSMKMWIDAGKIYFAYQGHLLSLPLSKS